MVKAKGKNLAFVLVIYLAGIFMGAIDTGIVTPARTVIQNSLGVGEQTGIWMITIYTLAYAASIPIMGKLADKFGRKYVYLVSISLFGLGSLFCGLSSSFGSFPLLIASRAVQAVGGGGILPVATAEFGTSFPEEKRGMALGLVGGVYGIANIFGASAGSAILDIFGQKNWAFIFYINIPITIFVLIAGFLTLENNKGEKDGRIDFFGIFTLTAMVLSLLYGLKNIDFFNIGGTIGSLKVFPFLIVFAVLLPIFIIAEKKAQDPVMNLRYFTNKNIMITLIISLISGIVMMGMIFVPQFSENALKIPSGNGGYLVIILGLFAGIGAPVSGKLIDKFGAKLILGFGFAVSIAGSLFLALVATRHPNTFTVITSLILIGTGMGFTMGTPINYMMLDNTDKKESNSALATLSLVRSIGTAIAPAIMVGFIAHAGAATQGDIMALLPKNIAVPELPYVQEINQSLNKMKENPQMKDKLNAMAIPDLSSMTTMSMDMSGSNYKIPSDVLTLLQGSDVTTITQNSKIMAQSMFNAMTPKVISRIQDGISKGIDGINSGVSDMEAAAKKMKSAVATPMGEMNGSGMQGASGITETVKNMEAVIAEMRSTSEKMAALKDAVPAAFDKAKNTYIAAIDQKSAEIENTFQNTLNGGFRNVYLTTGIAAAIAMIVLSLYKNKKKENRQVL